MTTTEKTTEKPTTAVQVPESKAPGRLAVPGVNFARVVRSEWIKFTTLRSTVWIVALTIVMMVGISALMAYGSTFALEGGGVDDPAQGGAPGGPDAEAPAVGGLALFSTIFSYSIGQIVVVVLGVLIASSEYATGQIRSTLAAVPTRLPVLLGKALVVAVASFILGVIAVAGCAAVVHAILSGHGVELDLAADGVWRSLLGVPLYLMAIALFGMAIGFLLRHTAGAISLVLGVLLVLPIIGMIQIDWLQDLAPYLPADAGERLIMGDDPDAALTPWQGFAVLGGYVVALLTLAGVLLRRRDA